MGAANAASVIVSPVSILNSPSASPGGTGTGFQAINAINQSGLTINFTSGVTGFDPYIASNPIHTNFSQSMEWFAATGETSETLDLDLGSTINLGLLVLWNEETYGVGNVEVFSSTDATFTSMTSLGSFSPIDNPLGTYPAEVFDMTDASTRYVRMTFTSVSGSVPISVGEIAFGTAVPEPSSAALLGLVSLGLLFRRSRR